MINTTKTLGKRKSSAVLKCKNVTVHGSTAAHREYAKSAAKYYLRVLLPRSYYKINVQIFLLRSLQKKEKICADCTHVDYEAKEFEIRIDVTIPKPEWLKSIAHECVHVKQYHARSLVYPIRKPGHVKWKGKLLKDRSADDRAYYFSPWEIEAHGLDHGLFFMWKKQSPWKKDKWPVKMKSA